jgi:hypothetical protein
MCYIYIYILFMERGLVMFCHAFLIAILLYVFMIYVVKQRSNIAENRSIFIAAFALMYMILFGHGLPTSFNKDIMM